MPLSIRCFLAVVLVSTSAGCIATPTSRAADSTPRRVAVSITPQELQGIGGSTAYDAVQSLRPQWLRARGVSSALPQAGVQVYVDHQRMGGLESLRTIPRAWIASAEYLNGIEATRWWGTNHGDGVIHIHTLGSPS